MKLLNETPDAISLKEITRLTKHLFGQVNVISIPRIFIDLTGDHISAILLHRIIYWSERTDNPQGWFYKDADGWLQEIAISYGQLARAMKKLRQLGIETRVRKVGGAPTSHYRVDREKFTAVFLRLLETMKGTESSIDDESKQ